MAGSQLYNSSTLALDISSNSMARFWFYINYTALKKARIFSRVEDNNIKVIFIESEAPSVYAETIVSETGIKAVEGLWVETLKVGQSYPDFLISAVELIVENLRNTD